MKIRTNQAIVVEGRDDVDAVSKAVDTLIIATHGFGIRAETWAVIEKAYEEKGLIILTDPDFSGEEIRRKLTARFPNSIQAYVSQEAATLDGDIGIENSTPEVIAAAIELALANSSAAMNTAAGTGEESITMTDLSDLGLAGTEGSSELRKLVCAELGIGYGNARTLINKLAHWGIGLEKLEQTVTEIKKAL